MPRNAVVAVIYLLLPVFGLAQMTIPPEVTEIQKQLEAQTAMTYDFSLERKYPDGTVNRTKGRVIKGKNFFAEINPEQLVLQNDKWYYKLDHANKTVYVIDMSRFKKQLSGGNPVVNSVLIPDSIITKYGKLDMKTEGQVRKIRITFGPQVLIRELYMEYDLQRKVPNVYKVQMKVLYGIDGWKYEESYLDQVLTATHFLMKAEERSANMAEYFTVEHGKVKLKKYGQYKLIQQI